VNAMKVSDRRATKEEILRRLSQVQDPEIPVLNIVEMGIVRDIEVEADRVRVDITPTYSGCPAMHVIRENILSALDGVSAGAVEVRQVYAPPWTTDWLTESAKEKLRVYGIAPPRPTTGDELVPLRIDAEPTPCPLCGSSRTELRSAFGSTPCKEFHHCLDCRQPFEAFKSI